MRSSDIIIYDTETTGLDGPSATNIERQPYITEIYAVRLDKNFNLIDEFETMIRPPVPISEEITRITGITQDDVDKAKAFISYYDELYNLFEGVNYVAGHNIEFDLRMIRFELFRYDFEYKFHWPRNHICTVEKSYQYKNKRLTLQALHEYLFGVGFSGAHRARTDVEANAKCFIEMVERGDIKYPL